MGFNKVGAPILGQNHHNYVLSYVNDTDDNV